ncbi:glycosyltransferase [Caballeronia sp. GaOx3]|uniref:glycosyltransferase n=1 Tax=Caballeronia sp. GaOx3 TaxID=2921740 RepID=UPI002027ACA2|nr:glycosyltransferase [Caballeronia sp. GaOx3]
MKQIPQAILDLALLSPEHNFGAGGDARKVVDINRLHSDAAVIWQQSVYEHARTIAETLRARRIVDVGVGGGQKLLAAFADYEGEFLQVDWADKRDRVEGKSLPPFLQANLEDPRDVELFRRAVDDDTPTLIIFSDVIEHLNDVRPIIRIFRKILKRNRANRLIISTPDRDRVDGIGSKNIPDNPAHARQWNASEFSVFLRASALDIKNLALVPQNEFDKFSRTILAEVSCDVDFYSAFLRDRCLPEQSDHLVITSEHSNALSTGGIGTYYQVAEEHSGHKRIVLFSGSTGLPEDWVTFSHDAGWLHATALCGRSAARRDDLQIDAEEVLAALQIALFIYDAVKLVEYQDYVGIGFRVAQAKRAGMLPPETFLMAYAHGNHGYLDNAAGEISRERPVKYDAMERLSAELADCLVFPTRFMEDLYLNRLGFLPRQQRLQPYPVQLADADLLETKFGRISKIVFYGKPNAQKGYPEFCNALLQLFADPQFVDVARQIEEIVVLGTERADERLYAIPNVKIICGKYSRNAVVTKLEELSIDSLAILPYKGDNHPLSIFEIVGANCQFVAFKAGGLPEQIPTVVHPEVMCEPNSLALANAIARSVSMPFHERTALIARTRHAMASMYRLHSESYLAMLESFKQSPQLAQQPRGNVDLIISNFNGSRAHLADVVFGINNSFHRPAKTIFVDDKSTEENFQTMAEVSETVVGGETLVVRNERNVGLAGARNAGLQHVKAQYVCTHDNDDIMLNNFLGDACRILDENPHVAAVTCYDRAFNDGDNWFGEKSITNDYIYRPIGMDFGLGLTENPYGPSLAVFRTSVLKELGGWDDTSRGTWEDWQLFSRMAGLGKEVWVIPKVGFLYRVRPASMLRTYPTFPGWIRLSHAFPGLPANQRFTTMRAVLTPNALHLSAQDSLRHRISELELSMREAELSMQKMELSMRDTQVEIERLSAIEASTTWRATRKLREVAASSPRLSRYVRRVVRAGYRVIRKLMRS